MHQIRAATAATHFGANPGRGGARPRHVASDLSPDRDGRAAYSFRRACENLRCIQLSYRRASARRSTRQRLCVRGEGNPRPGIELRASEGTQLRLIRLRPRRCNSIDWPSSPVRRAHALPGEVRYPQCGSFRNCPIVAAVMPLRSASSSERSSREVPHGSPLAHHRAYGPRTTAVCPSIERGMAGGRIEQSELAEPSAVDGDLRLQRISQTPPPAAGGGQLASGSRRDPVLSEELAPSRGLLALFEPHAAQLAAPPAIQAAQLAVCLGVTEGRHPSGQVGIGLVDHLPQADRPVA